MKKFNLSGGFSFSRVLLVLTSLFLAAAFNTPFLILLGIVLAILVPKQLAKKNFGNTKTLNKVLCAVFILSLITSGIVTTNKVQIHNENVATETISNEDKTKEEERAKLEQEEKAKQEKILAEEAKKKQDDETLKQKQIEEQKIKEAEAAKKAAEVQVAVSQSSTQSNVQASNNQGVMVWLSETGDKYHSKPNCGRMNPNNASKVDLSSAKKSYAPCKKCHPPV